MKRLEWRAQERPIVALSPMADMTDSAFCRVVKSIAAPVVFREMVCAEAVVRANEKTLAMTDVHPDERPIIQQIFGSDPHIVAEAARIIVEKKKPEGIDINMGCPVCKMVNNFHGAALMKDAPLACQIIKAIKAAVDVPVSVKIRLGWSHDTDCLDFAPALEQAGASLISIHGRTKVQGYAGKSNWEMIRQVKERLTIPLLANGDIFAPSDALRALEHTKCDGVLIARGALGNPWIFSNIQSLLNHEAEKQKTVEEIVRVVKLHADLHEEQYGPRGIVTFRKHLTWYFKGLPHFKIYRERLHQVSTKQELFHLLDLIVDI